MPKLRLIEGGSASGIWNMAVDAVLLEAVARGGAPTLRLYRWRGAWLSLGYRQRLDPARQAACRAAGIGIVVRPTGGGAVLHGRDLTYALALPRALLPAELVASYRRISGALREALRRLGVEAEEAPGERLPPPRARVFDCFAGPAPAEICVRGAKLAGSAQRRLGAALLQHGSIRVFPDPPDARAAAGTGAGAISLAELGVERAARRLRRALAAALAETLGATLLAEPLAPDELRAARRRARALRHGSLDQPLARSLPPQEPLSMADRSS